MPNKTKPVVDPSNDVWGNKLNQHLEQLMPDDGGGINKFEQFSQRLTNLTADDKGKTYLYTQTGNLHQWDGAQWIVFDTNSILNVKDYGAVGDGAIDDSAAILALDTIAISKKLPITFSTGKFKIKDITIVSDLVFNGGQLSTDKVDNGHIILKGIITAPRQLIFDNKLLKVAPGKGLTGRYSIPADISYPIKNEGTTVVYPEWWGAQPLNEINIQSVVDYTNTFANKNDALYDTNAFYSMHCFLYQGNKVLRYKIELKPNGVYWMNYNRWLRDIKYLEVDMQGAAIGNKSDWTYGTDLGFITGGTSLFSDVPPANVVRSLEVTSEANGDILAGSVTVKLKTPTSASQYQINSWVIIASCAQYSAGWPPSFSFYSYHKIISIDTNSSVITLDSPIADTHRMISPTDDYKTTSTTAGQDVIGLPILIPFDKTPEEIYVHDGKILPNPTKASNSLYRTVFHNDSSVNFKMKNIEFIPHPTSANCYHYVSTTKNGHIENMYSTSKLFNEPDKNVDTLTYKDCKTMRTSGGTGVKNMNWIGCSFADDTYINGKNIILQDNISQDDRVSAIGDTKYLKTDKDITAARSAGGANIYSYPEFDITNNKTLVMKKEDLQRIWPIKDGKRFHILKNAPQATLFGGIVGKVGKLIRFTNKSISQSGTIFTPTGDFEAEYEIDYVHVDGPNSVGLNGSGIPVFDNTYKILFPKYDEIEYRGRSYLDLEKRGFYMFDSSSIFGDFWNDKTSKFSYIAKKVADIPAGNIDTTYISPVGASTLKSVTLRVVKPYKGTQTTGAFVYRIINDRGNNGFQVNQNWEVDIRGYNSVKIEADQLRGYWFSCQMSIFLGNTANTATNVAIDNNKGLLPGDWDNNIPEIEVIFEYDSILVEDMKVKPIQPVVSSGNSIPTIGTWYKGDIVNNSNPAPGGFAGWICTADGTPGTWKGFGLIEV